MDIIPVVNQYLARQGAGDFPHLDYAELQRLIGAAKTEQTRLILKTLWHTLGRISEVLDVHVKDLIMSEVRIVTESGIVNITEYRLTIRRLKRRKKFEHELPIPADLWNELRLYARAKRRRGRIFTATRYSAWLSVRDLGREVLGRDISPKFTRHGRIYEMRSRNINPVHIARCAGHVNMASAMAYGHPTPADIRNALGL